MAQITKVIDDQKENSTRRNRLWLQLTINKDNWTRIKNRIRANDSIAASDVKDMFEQPTRDAIIYLPMNGSIPVINFKNEYDNLLGDLDQSTRALAGLIGQSVQMMAHTAEAMVGRDSKGTGAGLKNLAKNAMEPGIDKAAGVVDQVGGLIASFSGNIHSTKLWRGIAMEDFPVGGQTGFENAWEYKYFKLAEMILQMSTSAQSDDGKVPEITNKIKDGISSFISQNSPDGKPIAIQGPFKDWNAFLITQPPNRYDIQIIAGVSKQVNSKQSNSAMAIEQKEPNIILMSVKDCFLSDFEITYGTELGQGFDNYGRAMAMSLSLTFTPESFKSVVSGFKDIYQSLKLSRIETALKTASKTPSKFEAVDYAAFLAMNLGLVNEIPKRAKAFAQGASQALSFLGRRTVVS